MKKLNVLLAFAFFAFLPISAIAQDEITNEDLRRYALLNEVIDAMKSEISVLTNKMIKNQEGFDGKRYKELQSFKGDEAKLDELGANDFEKKFMMLVYKKQEERKTALKEVNSIMATKMINGGAKKFKAIKEALKSDEAVKERYAKIQMNFSAAEGDA